MKCDECRFWVLLTDELHNFEGVKEDGIGVCYRYPPTCTGSIIRGMPENRKFKGEWHNMGLMERGWRPAVAGNSWCGVWKQKND
ncbi:MAG: hypothetical protein JJE15_15950 [Desulfobacteraceae bacterium]|nr:hypothetical protein [Desulfobacteraceae bacterium]